MKKLIIGIFLIILSMFMLMGFFRADIEGGMMVKFIAFLIAVAVPMACGVAVVRSHFKSGSDLKAGKESLALKTREAEVLKLAEQKGGKLTVVEVVKELALDKDTARDTLDSLAAQSLAEIELTESGVIVYSFYDIRHLNEKESARGVLDT